jgi:hypothetical protein
MSTLYYPDQIKINWVRLMKITPVSNLHLVFTRKIIIHFCVILKYKTRSNLKIQNRVRCGYRKALRVGSKQKLHL